MDEIRRSVNRVDHPGEAARPRLRGVLLAHDPVIGEGVRQSLAHESLDIPVGLGNKVLMAFHFDIQPVEPAEIVERERARLLRDAPCTGVAPVDPLPVHTCPHCSVQARLAA